MWNVVVAISLLAAPKSSDSGVEDFFTSFDAEDLSNGDAFESGFLPTYHGVAATHDGGFVVVGDGHDVGSFLFRRGFVAKFAADGRTAECARFIGGSGSLAMAVAVASDGRVAVAGVTQSAAFPNSRAKGTERRTRSAGDPYVVVFSPDLSRVEMSIAFGGGGADIATSIAFDSEDRIFVAGGSESSERDEFESPDAARMEAHRNGGNVFLVRLEHGVATLVDLIPTGRLTPAYVACTGTSAVLAGVFGKGNHASVELRIGPAGDSDLFLARYVPTGRRRFLLAIGGSGPEDFASDVLSFSPPLGLDEMCEHAAIGGGLAIDSHGNAVICGSTRSVDIPTTPGVFQPTPARDAQWPGDGFVAIVDAGGALVRATYLSTHDVDEPGALAIARDGDILIGGRCHDRAWIDGTHDDNGYEGFVLRLDADLTRATGHAGFIGDTNQWVEGIAIDSKGRIVAIGGSNAREAQAVEFDSTKPRTPIAGAGWHAIVHRFE